MPEHPPTLHATCVALRSRAALLRGPSGAGKSDLALRLLDQGWELVSDDRVALRRAGGFLFASPPASLVGMLEIRGLGIVRTPYLAEAPLALIVDLVSADDVPRMPEAAWEEIHGIRLPKLALCAHFASTPAALRFALETLR